MGAISCSVFGSALKSDKEVSKVKSVIKASKNWRFFDALITDFTFETSLSLFTKNLG
jgi:hypothetical protein